MNPMMTIHPRAALTGGAPTGRAVRTGRFRPLILAGIALSFLLGGLSGADAVRAGEVPPAVLVLNAYHQGEDWSDNEIAGLIPVLRKRYPDLIPAVEHLDTKRFPHADHLGRMGDYLARKYRGRRIDLLLALDNPALALICERGADLFAGVPVVFAGINGFHPEMVAGRKKVTGVVEHQDMAGTLRLAMQLQPEARKVLAVHDRTASGLALRREMEALIPQFAGKLEIAFSPEGAVDDLLREVATFPRDGIVLLLTYVTDAAGRTLSREESTRLITSRSRAPVYAMHETRLGYGIAGGLLLEGREHGKQAANLALRVLAGEDADRIPVQTSGSRTILDYRVVSRLGIPEARWPAEAVVVNRPTSLWLEHRSVLMPALLAIGILSLGLILLLVTVRRMRRAEAALRESHQLNEQIIQSVNEGVIVYGADLRYKLWNPYMESLTGLSARDVMGRHPLELFPFLRHSGAMERIERALAGEAPPAVDFPFTLPGNSRSGWSSHKSGPLRNAAGQIVGVIATVREITEYKQAEEALRQSERKFRDVFESIAVGILVQQRDGSVSEANPAAERILGVGREGLRSPEEINARLILLRDDGTPWPAEEHPSIVTLKNGFPVRNAVMGVRVPGREGCRWINVNTVPHFRDGETAPQAVFITFDDITERREAEAALGRSENLLRKIFEILPVGLWIADKEGQLVSANPAGRRIWGAEPHLGRPEYGVFKARRLPEGSEIAPEDWALARTVREGVTVRDEMLEIDAFDGQKRTILNYTAPVLDGAGKVQAAIVVNQDITARLAAEAGLRESEEKYRLVVENAREAIIITQNGRLLFVNRTAAELIGYPEERLVAGPFGEFIHPEDRERVMAYHLRRLNGEAVPDRYELRVLCHDGQIRWAEMSAVLIQWQKKPATLNFLNDITERKALEQERQAMAERLQRAEKMEALGTLAGGVAHDLNNVLGIVVGYAEMLLEQATPADPQRQDLARIMDGGVRAAAIVQDLLALARRGVQNRKVLNLNAVVLACRQTPEFEKALLANPRIRVETDLEADLLNVTGSPVHLGKTLLNLVVNAVEAMPAGGVLTIATGNRYVDRPIQGYDQVRAGDYAVLVVTDTGEGISPGDLTRVFEPFYTKKVMGRSGTGLGLAVVWGTVKDHNGYIDVESQTGRGTSFTLYFPVTRDDAAAEEAAVPLTEYLGRGEAVLVVDDVREQRELAARMLGRLGYAVATAASGEEAVAWLRERRADLVVLDMIMDPGMDGLETYRAILEIHPRQKAVIVSGFSETDRVNRAQALGAGSYVRKPYILERLGMAVRRELDDRRQRP